MKITRRAFLVFAVLAPLSASFSVPTTARPPEKNNYFVYVGTYTEKTQSKGIYEYRFDAASGSISSAGVAAETVNPSFLAVHPSGKYLYAVNEAAITDGDKHGAVSAFSIDPQTGKLTLLNQVSSLGVDPCFISFDKTGKYALVANYTSGSVAVFPVLGDGKIGKETAFIQDSGKLGPNAKRQEGPHAHFIATTADNRYAVESDLGLDEILVYKFDASNGTLTPNDPPYFRIKPGSGPRHIAFSADDKFAYVVSEMGSTVTALRFDARKGSFKQLQAISTLPPGYSGRNDAAEIAIHPNGKFLYASNRGNDSIAIYAIDPKKGTLTPQGGIPTGGKEPRHFTFDPSGKFMFIENQFSDQIVVTHVDPATGALSSSAQTIQVPSPVCLVFVPMQ
ncbi:MAG TPA: lactonase family protein [Candidatus Acidoferrum sp.]|nr:lactonase family protein [Candidatus Acidoferrum sp.]